MARKNRKTKKGLIIIFLLFLFFLVLGFFYNFLGRSTFVSPLPSNDASFFEAENIEALLKKNNISFSEIKSSTDSSILVRLATGGDVLFSSTKSLSEQVSSLQPILFRLTIEGKRFKNLDLRFDKPVIRYE
ncbi:MAG: hypothetical protein HYY87_04140 [Candidatus Levybacteria bacterium]|nr:hypothetical protein [Candidatus Levybacteria bacterium]MBI2190037.1 hypothetical protein [Candidatus Levybacteria bacterium]MBI2622786.1 hypothetical protein [Candidatus Levybacteria bacterium]MBI3070463.1 hypothetical protein [Candidatus Levybacteria bacterium]MBI3092832.1 hypothetical protein [Candidatus Levybacteria bacterium]